MSEIKKEIIGTYGPHGFPIYANPLSEFVDDCDDKTPEERLESYCIEFIDNVAIEYEEKQKQLEKLYQVKAISGGDLLREVEDYFRKCLKYDERQYMTAEARIANRDKGTPYAKDKTK